MASRNGNYSIADCTWLDFCDLPGSEMINTWLLDASDSVQDP